jgi:uncharacterized protein DUF4349
MTENRKAKLWAAGTLIAIFAVIALAFTLGGGSSSDGSAGSASGGAGASSASGIAGEPAAAAPVARAATGSSAANTEAQSAVDAVTATSVVKTGSMELQVRRGQVQSTVSSLIELTTNMSGYVSQSRMDTVLGAPTGELTLRMPVARFDNAVSGAEKLGHVISLTTSAHDVTGRVVDLGAQVQALTQTRSTYLTILGRAKTIGATLEVQQRVEDVQQQIEELQGELKVLHNQSADGTLTVNVSQVGAAVVMPHHHHGGIGSAWHTSISRFTRGFDDIVSALGPLILALLVIATLAAIGGLGYRGVRRTAG